MYIGIAMGVPTLYPYIRKFQFYTFNVAFGDIMVENTTAYKKIRSKQLNMFTTGETYFVFFFLKMRNSMPLTAINMNVGISTGFLHR